ncbi:hypothetical protein B0H13DRAFT_2173274 [Mycena leptocephala]|nr:hypothetical protein B0H13DRAFT_2173274 [Mycena leptocephala]
MPPHRSTVERETTSFVCLCSSHARDAALSLVRRRSPSRHHCARSEDGDENEPRIPRSQCCLRVESSLHTACVMLIVACYTIPLSGHPRRRHLRNACLPRYLYTPSLTSIHPLPSPGLCRSGYHLLSSGSRYPLPLRTHRTPSSESRAPTLSLAVLVRHILVNLSLMRG